MNRIVPRVAHVSSSATSPVAKFGAAIAILAVLACLGALTARPAHADDLCRPSLRTTQTDFPVAAQHLNQSGTVQVAVRIGASGRAESAAVHTSSGYPLLDHAAVDSVRKHWTFAIAHCSAEQLRVKRTVAVHFRHAQVATVSGTIDVQALAAARAMHADPHCHALQSTSDTTVFSCIARPKAVAASERAQPVLISEAAR